MFPEFDPTVSTILILAVLYCSGVYLLIGRGKVETDLPDPVMGNYNQAVKAFGDGNLELALELLQFYDNPDRPVQLSSEATFDILLLKGQIRNWQEDFSAAILLLQKAKLIAEQLQEDLPYTLVCVSLANAYSNEHDYTRAHALLLECIPRAEQLANSVGDRKKYEVEVLACLYYNYAITLEQFERKQDSIYFYEKVLLILEQAQQRSEVVEQINQRLKLLEGGVEEG